MWNSRLKDKGCETGKLYLANYINYMYYTRELASLWLAYSEMKVLKKFKTQK